MYTLRITDDNNVITTVKESLMEKSNCVNSIQIIINKFYKEQIDMTDTTAYMKYVLPVTKKIKMTQLIADTTTDESHILYTIPVTANISAEPGDIEVSFTFLKLVHDEESDTTTSYVRKTESGLIHITKLAQFDSYEPSEMLTELDQRILALMATAEDIKKLGQATYDNMPIDMKLDSEAKKLTLVNANGNTGDGVGIADLSDSIAKELTGTDPDGTQDGVTHIDKVTGVQSLDELLK
ncbi:MULTISPECIES: hypothetical protein [unclassified Ruminococcus]|jgi:hypothetical protein|uniref:hypothetical protein n=1 Tax=unclassified Ruminococcus TaxID=2608920 RepID=UPI00189D8B58|nr:MULTISPECIES: hypothetical protein [unclassified Ruminococcus]DAU20441.1 MAG TPA: hypothetical protein [Caudoviricetes sp.]MDB8755712.1 hypothetical protein [Ruminococcus sp. 1001136sp1]MDB8759814.1 hypothetical protein [Ruminococcus sp. 1001136sp1]MDB8763870.1 hypothetical protein [Ruminococcus sp. 1001136sp1]MDB8767552.1 hypothetical protein [Ruminococcus sp. 1001136sp1]